MRKIIVLSMITLDGVMQGPGGPQEDTSGNFKYGGWTAAYGDEVFNEAMMKDMGPADYLLGRKTFQIFEPYWPKNGAFWPAVNEGNKYVLSQTLQESDWKHTHFLKSLADIEKLKQSEGKDIQVWGSGQLVQLLLKHNLVDELRLKIYPVVLGEGKKLFNEDISAAAFTLVEHVVTPSGVIIANYKRSGEVKTGTIEL